MPREDFPIYNPRGSNSTSPSAGFTRPTWTYEQARNQDFVSYGKLKNERTNIVENKPFLWPGPNTTNIGGETKSLVRGFMRSILYHTIGTGTTAVDTAASGIRLNFQFNPEYIQRDVTQSPGAVNPLLQNITNLTQPVPGTAQFNFTITFNREHEVAMGGDFARRAAFNFAENEGLALKLLDDPSMVGVMHDLAVFDKIIGQGISTELVQTLLKFTEKADKLKPKDTDESEETTAFDATEYEKGLNANIGNSAFLNPLPVRIVFGDLFMVEGFVTGSAVAFQKFNRQMIPTICQINCNLSALYFGFAKKSAFLTDNLKNWYEAELGINEQTKKDTATAEQVVANMLQKFQYVINSSTEGLLGEDDYNLDIPSQDSNGMRVWRGNNIGQYYPGNNSSFMTLPQWFSAFSDSDITVAGNMAKQIYDVFTQGQTYNNLPSNLVGWTPVLVVIDVMNPYKEGSTTARMTSKEMPFNLSDLGVFVEANGNAFIRTTSANVKRTVTVLIKALNGSPGGGGGNSRAWNSWEKVGDDSHSSNVLNQWYGIQRPASSTTMTQYMRIFWINPEDVGDKEVLNSTDACELVFNWEIKKTKGNATGVVALKEQAIPYAYNTPFISNNASHQRKTNTALTVRKGTGTGPRNTR